MRREELFERVKVSMVCGSTDGFFPPFCCVGSMGGRKASWWHREGERVRCELCPNICSIAAGSAGICGTRVNEDGVLIAASYGDVRIRNVDQIEKKPIYHYRPGTSVLSLGTSGCNLDCDNCQNYQLVKAGRSENARVMTAQEVTADARRAGAQGIAWTFNEPTVWYEFVLDSAREAAAQGLYTVLNTNGFICPAPAKELFMHVQAVNVDVKGFTDGFYKNICGGRLQEVLDACILAREAGVHIELTYLSIPGLNDSAEEISRFCRWVVDNMGVDTPVFFFRFRPFHRLSHLPEQSMAKLDEARSIARREGIRYIYLGGVAGNIDNDTRCPHCSARVVERECSPTTGKVCFKGGEVSRFCPTVTDVRVNMLNGRCPRCGEAVPIIL